MRNKAWLLVLVGGAVVVLATQLLAGGDGGPVWVAVQAAGTALTVLAVRRRRPGTPLGWWLLVAARLSALLVATTWIALPSLATETTVGLSLTVPFLLHAAAGYVLTHKRRAGAAVVSGAEAGSMVLFLTMLAWCFVVQPFLVSADGSRVGVALAVAHSVIDVAILATVLRGLACAWRGPARLLAGGGAMLLGGHVVFAAVGGSGTGPFLPGGYSFLSVQLWGVLATAAALHPQAYKLGTCAAPGERTVGRGRLVAMVAVALASPLLPIVAGVIGEHGADAATVVPALITAGLCALLLIRIGLLARLGDRRARELGASLREREQLQQRLEFRAGHDTLTGLANRELLLERLGAASAACRRPALLVCGLDGFKDVNDTYGHAVGDALLQELSARLLLFAPEVDVVARLGGDEFGILLTEASPDRLGEQVVAAVAAGPFEIDERRIHLTMSAGHAAGPPGASPAAVLGDADLALRSAKRAGGARLIRFDESLRAEQNERACVAAGLRRALADGDLLMHYQPVVETGTGRIRGVEALMRWRQDGTLIAPGVFIPVAEQTGLIGALGTLALRLACRQAVSWHRRYGLYVTVNVSTHQLRDPGFGDEVLAILAETGLPGAALVLEITESVLIDAADTPVLGRLRSHGIRIAIDDFGTGYSSLAYLHRLPVDILKIDRSFVDRQDAGLTRAILDLARSQDLIAVAEGVETAAQAELLRSLDCPLVQGYHFSRPAAAEVIEELVHASSKSFAA